MSWVKTRRVFQILFLIFFLVLFLKARYPYENNLDSDLFLRFSPLIPLFDFIDHLRISWLFWPALLIILFTLFLGRFFCGWICPLGTTLDITSKIVKSPSNKTGGRYTRLRYLKFGILLTLIILAIFSVNVWGYLDPLSLFNRVLTVVLYPFTTLVIENTILLFTKIPFLENNTYDLYDLFKNYIMPEKQSYLQQLLWITLFFIAIIALEKLSRRFWCRNLCPAGAWLGFLSQFRFYERIVGPACPVCNKCQVECKMNAIPEGEVKDTNKVECIECFNCGEKCPPGIKAITYRWRWRPYHSPVDFNRRQFMKTTGISLASLGLLSIGFKNRSAQAAMIRPPGALPEAEFLDRCIRCLQCVRICQSNGRCLQADSIHTHLLELWAPVAIMRGGYCEYNCNLCGQVCPSEAILPLSLEEKNRTPMGLACFNKNLCIPYARNKDCLVCEEHCPLPEKAIKLEEKEITSPDGSRRVIKFPYVVEELCIGCGICEYKCPLTGKPGIFVTTENQRRLTKI